MASKLSTCTFSSWWLAGLVFFLISPSSVPAAFSFQISQVEPPGVSSPDQEVKVHLTLTDLPNPSYFRAAFQKASGEAYFGYLKNNSGSWVKIKSLSSNCHDYFLVSDTSATTLDLYLKVGEDQKVEPGQYQIKAHRLTAAACSPTEGKNTQNIAINFPSLPTNSPPPPPPTPTPAPSSTLPPTPLPTRPYPTPEALSLQTELSPTIFSPPPTGNQPPTTNHRSLLPAIPILSGLAMIGSSLWLFFRRPPA